PRQEQSQAPRFPARGGRCRLVSLSTKAPRKIHSARRAARAKKAHFPESWGRPAAAGKWRSCVLSFGESFERANLVARGKILKTLSRASAMGEIGLEQTFDPRWCVLRFHLAQNLAANRARGAKTAT